jgi:putative transposase
MGDTMASARLVRDYEPPLDVSDAMIRVAMGSLLLRRFAH